MLVLSFLTLSACASITVEDFNDVKKGMSLGDVQQILGEWYWDKSCKFDDDPEMEAAGMERYYCVGSNSFRSYTIGFTFKDGKLVRKYTNGRLD